MSKGNNGGVLVITKTAERLVNIEQEIRAVKELYFGNKISYSLANVEISELKEERDRLWAQDRS